MRTSSRFAVGIGITFLFASVWPSIPASAGSCWSSKRSERRMAKKINAARLATGTTGFAWTPNCRWVARKHTSEMVQRRSLYHTPSDVLGRRVTRWRRLGENIGAAGGVKRLHRLFMNSPVHRANILLHSYGFVGVGTKRKGASSGSRSSSSPGEIPEPD